MKKLTTFAASGLLIMSMAACGNAGDNETGQETAIDEVEGIDTNEEIEGIFRGFEGDETSMMIEYGGDEIRYPIAEDATGDLDTVEEGDSIIFTTRNVSGTDMVQTIEVVE